MSKKSIILFFISLVVILVASSLIQQELNKTPQDKAFIDNIGVPLSDEETKFIEKFYSDLRLIYNDYPLVDHTYSFNDIPPKKEAETRQIRLLTYNLLYSALDTSQAYDSDKKFSDMNSTMGTSSFKHYFYSKDWDKAFWSDIDYLYKEKYFAIVHSTDLKWPELEKGDDFYYTGTISGNVAIYDLTTLKCVAVNQVYVENGDDVKFKSYLKIEAKRDKLNKDLLKQYRKAIEKVVSENLSK